MSQLLLKPGKLYITKQDLNLETTLNFSSTFYYIPKNSILMFVKEYPDPNYSHWIMCYFLYKEKLLYLPIRDDERIWEFLDYAKSK